MRKILFFILPAMFSINSFAQNSARVEYLKKVNIHKNLSEEQKKYKFLLPEFLETQQELSLQNEKAWLKGLKSEEDDNVMQIQVSGGATNAIIDYKQGVVYNLHEFDARMYYVEDKIEALTELNFTGETKKILGYTCQKLVMDSKGDDFVLWIAKDLKIRLTPMPPLICDYAILSIENDKISYEATKIEFPANISDELNLSENAKQITTKQLKGLQEEMNEDMQR